MDIGEQIKELREKKNIVLEELALGVCTVECLRKIEQGKEMDAGGFGHYDAGLAGASFREIPDFYNRDGKFVGICQGTDCYWSRAGIKRGRTIVACLSEVYR